MTEHSNFRDSSQDQINSIKDFAVSRSMAANNQHSNDIGLAAKKTKISNSKKPNSAAQHPAKSSVKGGKAPNSNRGQQPSISNALRNSTNSFKGSYKQLYHQNQLKVDPMFLQNVSQLQKANAKLGGHSAQAVPFHKKTKSTGIPASAFHQAKSSVGSLLR